MWLHRILDNVFQNVVRHAGAGRYIGIQITNSPVQAIIVKTRVPALVTTLLKKELELDCLLYP